MRKYNVSTWLDELDVRLIKKKGFKLYNKADVLIYENEEEIGI